MEEEYPRIDGKPKQPVCIEYMKFQRQPVKLNEDGCNMLVLSLSCDETGRTVLNSLKTIYLIRSDTRQGWITNNRIYKTSSRFFIQGRMEPLSLLCSLAPDWSWLLSSPNMQSGKYNEMDPILIGKAVSVVSYTNFIALVPSRQTFVGREQAQLSWCKRLQKPERKQNFCQYPCWRIEIYPQNALRGVWTQIFLKHIECCNFQTVIVVYIKVYISGMEMSQRIHFWYQILPKNADFNHVKTQL